MANIKLTDATWLTQESNRVEGVLRQALGGSAMKEGTDQANLKAMVEYAMGPDFYTLPHLLAIRDELISRGVIQVV